MVSARDRKTLIGGLLAVATIATAGRAVPRWRAWDEQARTTAADLTGEVSALETQLRQLPALRDSARVRVARADTARGRLVKGATVGAAGADLATLVSDVADDLGIKVSAVQIRPDTLFRGGYARVAVSLTAAGDVTHLADLLTALESSESLLAVRELTVTPADVLLPDGRPETIRFQLLVEALAAKAAASDSVETPPTARTRRSDG